MCMFICKYGVKALGDPCVALCHHQNELTGTLAAFRCKQGELFDYLTQVVTLSEKRTR